MAYDLKLADRIRSELSGVPVLEKKIFGGRVFLLNGNTLALAPGASVTSGVNQDNLVVRES